MWGNTGNVPPTRVRAVPVSSLSAVSARASPRVLVVVSDRTAGQGKDASFLTDVTPYEWRVVRLVSFLSDEDEV